MINAKDIRKGDILRYTLPAHLTSGNGSQAYVDYRVLNIRNGTVRAYMLTPFPADWENSRERYRTIDIMYFPQFTLIRKNGVERALRRQRLIENATKIPQ